MLLKDADTTSGVKRLLRTDAGFVSPTPVFADLTGDGKSDAVVTVENGGAAGAVAVYVLSADGLGQRRAARRLAQPVALPGPRARERPDGDRGRPDLRARRRCLLRAPRHRARLRLGRQPEDVHAARDADGDGRPNSRKVPVTRLTARGEPCRARPRYSRSAVAVAARAGAARHRRHPRLTRRRGATSTSAAPCSSRSVRISEPDKHCASAILAYVQATAADAQVSSDQLAAELLELWHHLTRGASQQLYGLLAELDISITQMKTLHALDDCADEVSVKELAAPSRALAPGRQPHGRRPPAPRLARAPRGRRGPAHEARRHHPRRPRRRRPHRDRPPRGPRGLRRLADPRAASHRSPGRALRPPPPLMTRIRSAITDDNRRWWTLGAMCFALFMVMLDNTVVNVALPSIQKDLHTSISGLEWTVNAYTLSFAVLLVTGGRLGDIFGRRRMFLFGVVVFGLSSAFIGFSQSEAWLVAGRAAQGIGAAFMMPATLSIISNAFPAARARQGDRHLGRRQRAGARHRPGGRRLPRRERLLAVDLLPQRAGRRAGRRRHARRHARVARRDARRTTSTSPAWPPSPSASPRSCSRSSRATRGAGARRRSSRCSPSRPSRWSPSPSSSSASPSRWSTSVSSARARSSGANLVAFIVSFAMLAMFFFLALYMQNIKGYSPLAGRRALPAVDRGDHRRRPDRRAPDGPHRPAAADDRRAADRRRLAVLAGPPRRSTRATGSSSARSC